MKKKLPDERSGVTLRFTILNREESPTGAATVSHVKGYVQTGEHEDGKLGEIFVRVGKAGSREAVFDSWAMATSIALQHGADVDELFGKFVNMRFEPHGAVLGVAGVKNCSSVFDLVSKIMISRYGKKDSA